MVWGCVILLVIVLALAAAAVYLYAVFKTKGSFFDANGVRLHYVEAGKGTPVILVHGLAINLAANWMFPRVFQNLAKRYRVIALDNRGHGRSDKPYDPEQYGLELVEDIVRLMDHLGIPKAHVVGYSLGGFITLRFALAHPERLLSAAPCGAGWTSDPAGELQLMNDLADDIDRGRGVAMLLNWLQGPDRPLSAPALWFMNFMTCSFNDMKAVSCLLHNVQALVATETEMRGNVVPCLAIVGGNDNMKVFADQMAAVMPNLELLVLPGCDHGTALMSRKTLPALLSFLERHTKAATL